MLIHEAFDRTLRRHGISAKTLAKEANISESHLSQFRNGKGGAITHTTLENLLSAMERLTVGSNSYFYMLLAGRSLEQADIDSFVASIDDSDLEVLFSAIAKRFSHRAYKFSGHHPQSNEQLAV